MDERKKYENSLNSGAEYVTATRSGVVSYKVDGLEEMLNTKDFGKMTKEFLESLNLKTGQVITSSEESGKIIDNYECYIATILSSENAKNAEVWIKDKRFACHQEAKFQRRLNMLIHKMVEAMF